MHADRVLVLGAVGALAGPARAFKRTAQRFGHLAPVPFANELLVGDPRGAVADGAAACWLAHAARRVPGGGSAGTGTRSVITRAFSCGQQPHVGGAVAGQPAVDAFVVGESADQSRFERAPDAGIARGGAVGAGDRLGHGAYSFVSRRCLVGTAWTRSMPRIGGWGPCEVLLFAVLPQAGRVVRAGSRCGASV
jgi:hypothetical protein